MERAKLDEDPCKVISRESTRNCENKQWANDPCLSPDLCNYLQFRNIARHINFLLRLDRCGRKSPLTLPVWPVVPYSR